MDKPDMRRGIVEGSVDDPLAKKGERIEIHGDIHADGSVDQVLGFTPQDERRLVRKLDRWIISLMMITYFLQSYDKGVMSSATQFGLLEDLGLSTVIGYTSDGRSITDHHKYSQASMMFYIGYMVGSYPMMYLSQLYPTSKVISLSMALWGATLMASAACSNYSEIMAARFFLGFFESVVAPAFTVMVTFWWTRQEQSLRTGLWYSCVGLAATVAPLVNYCLGKINGPLASWKPMFLVMGGVTCLWSIVLYFALPDSPLTTKGLTEAERRIAIHRLKLNNAGTIKRTFNKQQFIEALLDYKLYSSASIVLLIGIPSGALGSFGTIVIRGFGFDLFQSLALSSPVGFLSGVATLFVTFVSSRFRNTRYILVVICATISLGGTLICWRGDKGNRNLLYAGLFLLAVQVACGGMVTSIVASNIGGHTKKATVTASTFVGYCVGNVLGPVIFGLSPGPIFDAGFTGDVIALCLVITIATATGLALWSENKIRDREAVAPIAVHDLDEDLSDKQNRNFRYIW